MKAMILAAGLGTRLRPLTERRPKALIEVGGRTLLWIALRRLRAFGITEVIINVHHLAEMIIEYLEANDHFGMHLEVSREEVLLDTGGGLKKAAGFFAGSAEPFLLHNVDVISTIDFGAMLDHHRRQGALAALALHDRVTMRYLLFDEQLQLCGRRSTSPARDEMVRPAVSVSALAFAGVHIISPRLLGMMSEQGAFSIITTYLRLAAAGEKIVGFKADPYYWRDLGRAEHLRQVEEELRSGALQLPLGD